mgnify:FL=1
MEKKVEKNKKLNKKAVALIVAIVIIAFCTVAITINSNNKNNKGDVNGNLSNLGLVTESDGVVFYNKYENGIVKVKGNKEYQITNETAYSMQVVDDYIYYLTKGESNKLLIKKVKTNGDKLSTEKEIQTSISKFFVVDNAIYYVNQSGISKIMCDTKEENLICQDKVEDFAVDNNTIYYTDDFGYLYSMNLGGTDKKTILNDEITEFQVYDGWIYYYKQSENYLSKINIDGSENDTVTDKVNSYIFNIYKGKIYFYDSEKSNISCIGINGKNLEVITKIKTNKTRINLTSNGDIYYLDASNGENNIYQMYRIGTNGRKLNEIKY